MPQEVLYLHFGSQCPGFYMGLQAKKAAHLLGYEYREHDISARPDLAEKYNLFCTGTIVIGDFQLHYPGKPEQIVESYRTRSALPGEQAYEALPYDDVDETTPLTPETAGLAFSLCIPHLTDALVCRKREWLAKYPQAREFAGLIGFKDGKPVGFVEVLPETAIPYSIGEKRTDRAFITCLYSPSEWGLDYDYRPSLLENLSLQLKDRGYRGLSVISGLETPYPNGPEQVFKASGFERVKLIGKALLRHKWEEAWLMQLDFHRADVEV